MNDFENREDYDDNEEGDEPLETFENGEVVINGVNDLPIFANIEEKKLLAEKQEKENEVEDLTKQISDLVDRVRVMRDHFKNVQQEVDHTNSLNGAKQAEINAERHVRQLTSRALGRAQKDSQKVQVDIESAKEQVNVVQSQIYKANEKLDEYKMQMNWNQDELEQWVVAAKQKEDDFLAIEKYKRFDEQKIKDLTWELEQLTKDHLHAKIALENEATDTLAKQMELDRIAQDFKVAHNERQSLVNRWQETIAEMKKRDKEINDLGERFAIAKSERIKKEALFNTQRKRLQTQQNENREVEQKADSISRVLLKRREEMMASSQQLAEFRSELESLKNELTTLAEKLLTKRLNNQYKANTVEENKVHLERERQKYQVVKTKIEHAKNENLQAEIKAKEAEEELEEREKEFQQQLSKVKQLKEKEIKESQSLFELKKEETRLRSEISGSKSIAKNLEGQLNQLDKEAARQQELLYNAEFQIQQIERKIARGMGERSDEEKNILKKNIEVLEGSLEEVKEKRKLLLQQIRKLQNELSTLKTQKDNLSEKFDQFKDVLNEKELQNKMIEEEIRRDTKDYEEMTVQNDLLLLEVKKLKDLLSAKSDAVFSLENRKQQMLLSMEERKQEIFVHRDLLKAEQKALLDDRHRITLELRQRQANVEKLKSRFEVSNQSSEDDEKHSQAYYVIKAAQKREELQRRGDTLDQDIRKCEREIRALQLTLDHLNARNTAFRESFKKVDVKGEDVDTLKQLDNKIKVNKDALFRQKKDLQRLTTDLEEDSRRLEQVRTQYEKISKQRDHLENAKKQVEDEIFVQHTQLDELNERMDKVVDKLKKKLGEQGMDVNKLDSSDGTLEEKLVKSEVYRDVVQNVLYTLGQLTQEFPEVSETLVSRLQDADLRLPTKPPAKFTGKPSNNTSSMPTNTKSASNTGTYLQPKTFGIGM